MMLLLFDAWFSHAYRLILREIFKNSKYSKRWEQCVMFSRWVRLNASILIRTDHKELLRINRDLWFYWRDTYERFDWRIRDLFRIDLISTNDSDEFFYIDIILIVLRYRCWLNCCLLRWFNHDRKRRATTRRREINKRRYKKNN
jgi:hypothetical protein